MLERWLLIFGMDLVHRDLIRRQRRRLLTNS